METVTVGSIVEELVSKVSISPKLGMEGQSDILAVQLEDVEEVVIVEDNVLGDDDKGCSPKKKLKEHGVCSMDVDENALLSSENKENISQHLKKMSRKDLEDLVLVKVVESLVKHSEAGKFRTRVLELQTQKDKMFQRVGHLQKQVQELSKALKLLLDNQSRDPNNLNPNKKRPPPIKFYRSVGLQVTIEPSFRNGPAKVIHVNSNGLVNGVNKGLNAGVMPNSQMAPSTKRPGPKSLTEPKQQNNIKITNGRAPLKNSTRGGVASPTVVDLTDDTVSSSGGNSENLIQANNNVQYRLVNPAAPGVQYQLVTSPNNQNRILIAQNVVTNAATQGQQPRPVQLVVRNTNNSPKSIVSIATAAVQPQRPQVVFTATGTPNSAAGKPQTATSTAINVESGTMVRAPSLQTPTSKPTMQLPAFPPAQNVSLPRGRALKDLPPAPTLTLNEQSDGIVLSWTMKLASEHAEIASYQIYACQESLATSPGKISPWKKVGDVKALPLPMACTLSQFTQGNRYFFIVRAVDGVGRCGGFCEPGPIILQKK